MSNIIQFKVRPKCNVPECGKNAQLISSLVNWKFRKSTRIAEEYNCEGYVCAKHHMVHYGMSGWDYKIYRKDYCENIDGRIGFKCTTTIVDPEWQLDADHINGDPTSHLTMGADAIQTLCKCCHAIKTRDARDYMTPGRKALGV
jgi:hypothetical protein